MSSPTTVDILIILQKYVRYFTYIIFIAGTIGNLLNILVFNSLKIFRNNQYVFYFKIESIANIFQLIVFFLIRLLTEIYEYDLGNSVIYWCKLRSIIIAFCTIISFSAVCLSAYDQYLSTNHRFYIREMSTMKSARYLTCIATFLSALQSIPFGIFLEIRSNVCAIFDAKMIQYVSFFYYAVLSGVLPIFVSTLFSILAYRNVRRIIRRQIPIVRRRLDRQLTAMVLIRVIAFVILTLPFTVQRMYVYLTKINQSDLLAYAINNLFSVMFTLIFNTNYAISFYLFITSSVQFRRQVKYVLIKKYWRRWKLWFTCNNNQVEPIVEMRSTGSNFDRE